MRRSDPRPGSRRRSRQGRAIQPAEPAHRSRCRTPHRRNRPVAPGRGWNLPPTATRWPRPALRYRGRSGMRRRRAPSVPAASGRTGSAGLRRRPGPDRGGRPPEGRAGPGPRPRWRRRPGRGWSPGHRRSPRSRQGRPRRQPLRPRREPPRRRARTVTSRRRPGLAMRRGGGAGNRARSSNGRKPASRGFRRRRAAVAPTHAAHAARPRPGFDAERGFGQAPGSGKYPAMVRHG
jgi:hypothetical protein